MSFPYMFSQLERVRSDRNHVACWPEIINGQKMQQVLAGIFNFILKRVTISLIGLAIKAPKDSSIFQSAILKDIRTMIE